MHGRSPSDERAQRTSVERLSIDEKQGDQLLRRRTSSEKSEGDEDANGLLRRLDNEASDDELDDADIPSSPGPSPKAMGKRPELPRRSSSARERKSFVKEMAFQVRYSPLLAVGKAL